jgi:hypothetical protein
MLSWEPNWMRNDGDGYWWLLAIAGGFVLAQIAHAAVNFEQWKWMVK